MKANKLSIIPNEISTALPELEEIFLDDNQLKQLPTSLEKASKLMVLSIANNPNIAR